jgi:hypothetical protein
VSLRHMQGCQVGCEYLVPLSSDICNVIHPRFSVGFVLLDRLFYMYVLSIVVCPFVLFLVAIVLFVLLRYTVSDCLFGIFKLFLQVALNIINPNLSHDQITL